MDVQALKTKILSCGYNIVEFSDKVGIDRSIFYRGLDKDGNNFTIEEALRIKEGFSLTMEKPILFFIKLVSKVRICKGGNINKTGKVKCSNVIQK